MVYILSDIFNGGKKTSSNQKYGDFDSKNAME